MGRFFLPTLLAVLALSTGSTVSATGVRCSVEDDAAARPTPVPTSASIAGYTLVTPTLAPAATTTPAPTPAPISTSAAVATPAAGNSPTPSSPVVSPSPMVVAALVPPALTPSHSSAPNAAALTSAPSPSTTAPPLSPPTSTPTVVSTAAPISTPTPSPTSSVPPTPPSGGSTGLGTCYEPMHSQLYPLTGGDGGRVGEILDRDFAQLREHFTVVRTYHAQYFGLRVADYASKHGLKLFVGLARYPQHRDWEELEIAAAVEGAAAHPGTVEAILVGSEDLVQNGGDQTVDMVIARVQLVRQRLAAAGAAGVLVGTSQRINELVGASGGDMDRLVAACDFVGVNIYPFFTAGFDAANPVALLDAQWAQLRVRFGARIAKMRVTETGWPSAGAAPPGFPGNVPSAATQRAYFHAVAAWKPRDMSGPHFWFMAYDRRGDDPAGAASDYERWFGVYTSDNADKGVV